MTHRLPVMKNLILVSLLSLPILTPAKQCLLTGQAFESPTQLNDDSILSTALRDIGATLAKAASNGSTPFGAIKSGTNSFSVGLFDTSSNDTLFSFQHTAASLLNSSTGTQHVYEITVYRIGSLSKLITSYLFLLEAGPKYWNHAVTDFIPELAARAQECSSKQNSIDCIDWTSITLGALASHESGIGRDFSGPGDFSPLGAAAVAYGLPPLTRNETVTCNTGFSDPCSEKTYVGGIAHQDPVYAPWTAPVYSNAGYNLLGLALSNIIGQNISEAIKPKLFDRLNMSRSSSAFPANDTNAAIPGGVTSGFYATLANEIPAGGYFSTQNDLIKLGRSILSSSLLSPAVTRAWMKPGTFNGDLEQGVGKPWEIYRTTCLTNRTLDLYTKSGDLFAHSSFLVLSPDYNVGFIVLVAGDDTSTTSRLVSDLIIETLFPALENAAREQASKKFAGTYRFTDLKTLNSSLTLTTKPSEPGLVLETWISNGTDLKSVLETLSPSAKDIRLYLTGLSERSGNGTERVSYRATFGSVDTGIESGGVISGACITWFTQNQLQYGGVGLDEFVFEMRDGRVVGIEPRALRVKLEKAAA